MRKKIIWILVIIIAVFIGFVLYNTSISYPSITALNAEVIQKSEESDGLPYWVRIKNDLGEEVTIEVPNSSIWRLIYVGKKYTITYMDVKESQHVLEHIAPGDYNGRID